MHLCGVGQEPPQAGGNVQQYSERDGRVATIVLNRPHVLNCANEQWARDLNTIIDDHFYPEVIDPETGAVLPDGERGELVFTSLTKEALPIIRYRTRDLTTLLPPTARSMRRMAKGDRPHR
jgi:phenylacetate-CoA ligase